MVNNSGKTKHCHFCSPEPVQPRPAKLVPLRAQTYAEAVAWARPTTSPANKHQLPPVPSPEKGMQLACSGDMANHSGEIKHCRFCLLEQAQPGTDALQTLSQDPCPTGKAPMDLKLAKSEEIKSHGNRSFQRPTCQLAPGTIPPLGAPFGPVHFTEYPPNPAYSEFNLDNILIANHLARTKKTKYIGCKGKWYKRLPRLFKDKYNYLPAYLVPMTLPLTPRPDRPMEPTATAKTTSTQLFGVLYITLTGMVDFMVPNSGPCSLLGQSVSYIIKLAPILWWALPTSLASPHPEPPNASTYAWLPDTHAHVFGPYDPACHPQPNYLPILGSQMRPHPLKYFVVGGLHGPVYQSLFLAGLIPLIYEKLVLILWWGSSLAWKSLCYIPNCPVPQMAH
ncbi:hypothetical protein DSO57_1039224 [Entomophthora muscae]|uniref:Uncharacterized protein n=1 Tax=Entomophthora muscae TaxID=34485 RepID=A0ACC2UJB0_9FUNG|nr:hypothetical protein DSO57_1039224 [Entomophthora muscae]